MIMFLTNISLIALYASALSLLFMSLPTSIIGGATAMFLAVEIHLYFKR